VKVSFLLSIQRYLNVAFKLFELRVIEHVDGGVGERKGVNFIDDGFAILFLYFLFEVVNFLFGFAEAFLVENTPARGT
jgi:hypothetical protein